jgi:hypothetical protein
MNAQGLTGAAVCMYPEDGKIQVDSHRPIPNIRTMSQFCIQCLDAIYLGADGYWHAQHPPRDYLIHEEPL